MYQIRSQIFIILFFLRFAGARVLYAPPNTKHFRKKFVNIVEFHEIKVKRFPIIIVELHKIIVRMQL